MSWWDETKEQITESQVWKSIFRHGYDDTHRNRVLMGAPKYLRRHWPIWTQNLR